MGAEPDGSFKFSAGNTTIEDPTGSFLMEADFDEYTAVDTSDDVVLSSFGLLDGYSVLEVEDNLGNPPSAFLRDFADNTLFFEEVLTVEEIESRGIMGTDFAFITPTDLSILTNGYTQSALDVPATFIMSLNIPEPATLSLLALGGLLVTRRRRLRVL